MKAVVSFSLFFSFFTSSIYGTSSYLPAMDTCRVPTLITPNDDGQNDELIIPCVPVNKNDNQSELFVFNEWGERVLYNKPYFNDWTGTYRGQPLPDGTYFYIFRLSPATEAQRGYITIFR